MCRKQAIFLKRENVSSAVRHFAVSRAWRVGTCRKPAPSNGCCSGALGGEGLPCLCTAPENLICAPGPERRLLNGSSAPGTLPGLAPPSNWAGLRVRAQL